MNTSGSATNSQQFQSTDARNRFGFPVGAGRTGGAGTSTPALSISELLAVAMKHKVLVVAGLLVGLALGLAVALLTQPMYRGVASLEVSQDSVQMVEVGNQNTVPVTDRQFLETQYGLLRSRSLAERVARKLNLADSIDFADQAAKPSARLEQATTALSENFAVDPVEDSRLVRISYESSNPQQAADIANAFATNFIGSVLERRYAANDYARSFLQDRIGEVRARLETSERKLVAYAQNQQIVSVGAAVPGAGGSEGQANQSLDSASLSAANAELSNAQNARIASEQKYVQAQNGAATAEVLQSPPLQSMKSRLSELRSQYQQKLRELKPDHPDMVALGAAISALQGDITREQRTILSSLQGEFQGAAAREAELRARVRQLSGAVLDLRGRTIQYNILQRDVDTNRQLYDALLQKYKEVGVSAGIGENFVSVVDPAKPPTAPFKPDYLRALLIGGLLGLAAGAIAAMAVGLMTNRVRTTRDISEALGLSALGVVPRARNMSVLEAIEDPRSQVSEAYASLRSEILFSIGAAHRTLLITSSSPGEGKSTTALALALNFARLGHKTLLVDADLRHPSFMLAGLRSAGLAGYLLEGAPVGEVEIETSTRNLFVVTAGKIPPNPADLLASSSLERQLQNWRESYEFVVIDSSPILGLADAPLLAAKTDATVLVIEADRIRVSAARHAVERLLAANAKVIGAVLSKVAVESADYGYGYGYGYGAGEDGELLKEDRIRLHTKSDPGSGAAELSPRESLQGRHPAAPGGIPAFHSGSLLWQCLFVAAWLAASFLALTPTAVLSLNWSDRAEHIFAFATLSALGLLAFPKVRAIVLGAALAMFGGVLEIVQSLPFVGRDPDFADFLSDCVAIVAICALGHVLRQRLREKSSR